MDREKIVTIFGILIIMTALICASMKNNSNNVRLPTTVKEEVFHSSTVPSVTNAYPHYRLMKREDGLYEIQTQHEIEGIWSYMPTIPLSLEHANQKIGMYRNLRDREIRDRTMKRTPVGEEK